jgi:hypothetical protein
LQTAVYADEVIKVDKFYVTSIVKYRNMIALMQNFFADICTNNHKNIKFTHAKLQQLLKETGFVSGSDS